MANGFGLGFAEMERESGVTHWTWRRLAKEKLIRTIFIGSRVLIPMDEVERIRREGVPRHKSAKAGKR